MISRESDPNTPKLLRDTVHEVENLEEKKEEEVPEENEESNFDPDKQNKIEDEKEEALNRDSKDFSEEEKLGRSWTARTFGKMEEGSIRGGIFALSSLALGTGCLCLPIRATQFGCVWYMITVVLGSCASFWTLKGMIRAARSVGGKDYSISVRKIVGNGPGLMIDIIIMFYLFGVLIQYQVIVYSLIGRTYFDFFVDKNEYNKSFDKFEQNVWDLNKVKFPIMFIIAAIIMPLCLLKNISKMRFASMFGICALIYTILVVIIESPWYWAHYLEKDYKENDPKTHANWFGIKKSFGTELNFFNCISNVFFTYSCHPGAFPVYKSLKRNTDDRINKVFFRSILLDLVIYLFVTFCGFITAPLRPQSLIIFRESIFEHDYFMQIARVAVALELFLCLPPNFAPLRNSFLLVFFGNDKLDNKKNYLITIPIVLLSTLIGALYKDILAYISLLGGFCSSLMCFLFPGAMILQTSNKPLFSFKNMTIIVIIVTLCSIGFLSGIQTIRMAIKGK